MCKMVWTDTKLIIISRLYVHSRVRRILLIFTFS